MTVVIMTSLQFLCGATAQIGPKLSYCWGF